MITLSAVHRLLHTVVRRLLVPAIAWLPAVLWSQPAAAAPWALLPQAQVTAAGVFLDQLVAGSETNGVLHLRIADAPLVGHSQVFTAVQIQSLVKAADPTFAAQAWSGAAAVQVVRRTRPLPASEVLGFLKESLLRLAGRDQGQLEIRFLRPWNPPVIADELYSVRLSELPQGGLAPVLPLRFELLTEQESLGVWQMSVEVRLMREIWVCRQPLRRGDPVQEGDIAPELRDALRYRDLLQSDTDLTRGWIAVEPIQAGQPVLRRMLQLRTVVQKGQVVDALYRDGAIAISIKAEVLDSGAPGQVIRLRNPESRRELRGKVIDEKVVQIQL